MMKPIIVEDQTGADIDTAFAALTDVEHYPDFISPVERSERLTDGPFAAGTRWRETRTPFATKVTREMRVTACEPPHRFSVEALDHGTLHHIRYELEAVATGTRVTVRYELQPVSALAKMAGPFAGLMAGAAPAAVARELKAMLAEAERRILTVEAIAPPSAPHFTAIRSSDALITRF
jgi:hypothetical protein